MCLRRHADHSSEYSQSAVTARAREMAWSCFPTPTAKAWESPWSSSSMSCDRAFPLRWPASLRTRSFHTDSAPGPHDPQVVRTNGSNRDLAAVHRAPYFQSFRPALSWTILVDASGVRGKRDNGAGWHTATSTARETPPSQRGKRRSASHLRSPREDI